MQNFPETYRIPTKHATGIGRVIARFGYLEWQLSVILQRLAGTGPKRGRIALQTPRIREYHTKYKLLLQVLKTSVPTDLDKLGKDLQTAAEERNLLAHGLWIRHPKSRRLGVWQTTGAWNTDTSLAGTNRRIAPECADRDAITMRRLCRDLDGLIRRLRTLDKEVRSALRASQRMSR